MGDEGKAEPFIPWQGNGWVHHQNGELFVQDSAVEPHKQRNGDQQFGSFVLKFPKNVVLGGQGVEDMYGQAKLKTGIKRSDDLWRVGGDNGDNVSFF